MALTIDKNGFWRYDDTEFFRAGVFQYAGCEIDPDGRYGLDPKKLYNVYRPESEISKPDFIASLNQKPLLDDHTVIGNVAGLEDPDRKGFSGVLSEVRRDGDRLVGRVDVWSPKMIRKIRDGKRELSLAYGSKFIRRPGTWKGMPYDFVQSELKCGNHLALVDEARNGHTCKVVDCSFTCDAKIKLETDMPEWTKLSADELVEGLKSCSDEAKAKVKEWLNTPTEDEKKAQEEAQKKADEEAKKAADEAKAASEAEKKEAVDAAVAEAEKKAEEEKKEACDKAIDEYKCADELAKDCMAKAGDVFGTISMDGIRTEQDVAVKVCTLDSAPSALKNAKKSDMLATLKGYLASRKAPETTVVTDSKKDTRVSFAEYMKNL